MDFTRYFERINYTGDTRSTLENLRAIHRAHALTFPFENLNIHIPRPVVLDEAQLFSKFIDEQRGGFCYEQNGLFHAVLTNLGYEAYRLGATVRAEDGSYSPPMTHMCLMVVIDGVRYLADVGFGANFFEPIEIDNPDIQVDDAGEFKIVHDGDTLYLHNRVIGQDEMRIGYRFWLTPHELQDYTDACHYTTTSPRSHFTQKRVCSGWSEQGRITVTDDKFILTTWEGERRETAINNEAEFHALLVEHFGITVQTQSPQVKIAE